MGLLRALDCRIQNAPPPLMPEKATSASVRPAALSRPRIPSRSSARTARSPLVWLVLPARACHAEPLAAGSSLRALVTQNRWLLARPYACLSAEPLAAGSSLRALVTQNRWLLACPYARLSRRTAGCWLVLTRACYAEPLAAGSSLRVLVTQNRLLLARPYARLLRRTGLLPSDSLVTPPGLRAREFHWNSAALVQFHSCG
jgi:hypothetical protein